jgi:hypothetical protein
MMYEVSTDVEFVYRDMIDLPDITFCGNVQSLADWRNAKLKSKCIKLLYGLPDCINKTAE